MATIVNSKEICLEDSAEIFRRHFLDGRKDSNAGVVDEYVEPPNSSTVRSNNAFT